MNIRIDPDLEGLREFAEPSDFEKARFFVGREFEINDAPQSNDFHVRAPVTGSWSWIPR